MIITLKLKYNKYQQGYGRIGVLIHFSRNTKEGSAIMEKLVVTQKDKQRLYHMTQEFHS